ncbi:MAG TPA: M1 family metallopeptidase [Nitrospiraceae bacterium]|nr:M1 family metallopeptidase [Nitrospiraceae bacterium]
MTEPISRRQTLQTLIKHGRLLLAIPLTPFFSSWLYPSFTQAATEQPKGETMNQDSSPGTLDPYRLPRHVVPVRYDLRLEPDLTAARFTGQETITLTIHQATSEIVLNAVELDITSAQIEGATGAARQATTTLDASLERCHLTFTESLSPGTWRLTMTFSGTLNDKLRGFYRSTYKDERGATHSLAATQFEATDARRAFPCWDEPDFKAVFATTLVIDPTLIAVSNTTIAAETRTGGKKVVRFADTIKMSTYLVAFIVGRIESSEPTMIGNTPLRLWVIPGKNHLTRFGQDIAAASLSFFERYYGIPYPGDKLDLLAIPDFASGAMENLGAITYRETALLVDRQSATHGELERVADVVAHENAHMWFGDLVTMSWWNGLWLNEAFATFMEMLAVDAWKPEWKRWDSFGVARAAAFSVDGLWSTRPIEYPVLAPKDAEAMFDVLTYEKGASVLRMLEQHIGPTVFRDGVRNYLRAHAYGNADTNDLWVSLGKIAKQPVPELMNGWIFQPGYPLIAAELRKGAELVLTQQRFTYLLNPSPLTPHPSSVTWQIPLQMRITAGGKAKTSHLLLTEKNTTVPLPHDWESVLINEEGHGFYRVRYAPDLLDRLLNTGIDRLAVTERFNLINDAWATTVAGLMPLTDYLDLTARFTAERDKNVWAVLLESFSFLNRIIPVEDRPVLESFVRGRVGPAVTDLGWSPRSGESELTKQLRGELIGAQGKLGNDPAIQRRATELYRAYCDDATAVDPNVVPSLVAILAHTGDATRYDEFSERFRTAATPQEERRYLFSLAAFQPQALLERTLARTVSGDIRTQDAPFLISAILGNVYGRELAWAFVKTNWEKMDHLFPKQGLRRMCGGIVNLATPELERDVRDFFTTRKIDLGGKTLAQYLEHLRIAVTVRERESRALRTYLDKHR